jgi:polyphosphate kinase 2 (PPK2 family)
MFFHVGQLQEANMLEKINLNLSISKAEYQRRLPRLQGRLYDLEHSIFSAGIPVAIVFEGWAAAGKGHTIRVLAERLDPRGFRVVPITPPRTAEMQYPWMWRFWLKIPASGQIIVYDTSWYRRVLIDRVARNVKKHEWKTAFQDISEFEEQLAADGTVLIKFWMHISKKEQSRRFKKLLKDKLTAWQVTDEDAKQHQAYKKYIVAVEEMLARTDAPHAPWTIVEATDRYFTRIKVFETMIRALEARASDQSPQRARANRERRTNAQASEAKEVKAQNAVATSSEEKEAAHA